MIIIDIIPVNIGEVYIRGYASERGIYFTPYMKHADDINPIRLYQYTNYLFFILF